MQSRAPLLCIFLGAQGVQDLGHYIETAVFGLACQPDKLPSPAPCTHIRILYENSSHWSQGRQHIQNWLAAFPLGRVILIYAGEGRSDGLLRISPEMDVDPVEVCADPSFDPRPLIPFSPDDMGLAYA